MIHTPLRFLVVVLVSAPSLLARAQVPSDCVEGERADLARETFRAGQLEYESGGFERALRDFELAYDMCPLPELLYNRFTSQEHLGHYEEAHALLTQYLATLAADHPDRLRLERRLENLGHRIEASRVVEVAPPEEPIALPGEPVAPIPTRTGPDLQVAWALSLGAAVLSGIAWATLGGLALSEDARLSAHCSASAPCQPSDLGMLSSLSVGADIAMSVTAVLAATSVVLIALDLSGALDTSVSLSARGPGLAIEGSF